jgi:hypothetical protein
MESIGEIVRKTCESATTKAEHVKLNKDCLLKLVDEITDAKKYENVEWSKFPCHYFNKDDIEGTLNYIFILDALNFCFWPSKTPYEYDNLGNSIKAVILNDPNGLKP